jgi:hypothetical protein
MRLSSHALLRPNPKAEDPPALLVPDEAPPLDRNGNEAWPPGWEDREKVVKTEEDLYGLLGLPCWPPTERDCP